MLHFAAEKPVIRRVMIASYTDNDMRFVTLLLQACFIEFYNLVASIYFFGRIVNINFIFMLNDSSIVYYAGDLDICCYIAFSHEIELMTN